MVSRGQRLSRISLLPLAALVLALHGIAPATADAVFEVAPPPEPSSGVLRSGQCHVAVCTALDYGAYTLLVFAEHPPRRLRPIPRDACTCGSTRLVPVREGAALSVETTRGTQLVSLRSTPFIAAAPDGAAPDGAAQATAEGYRELPGITWQDTDFSDFRVFEKRLPDRRGKAQAVYRFIPKHRAFHFRGTMVPIVFASYSPHDPTEEHFRRYGPGVHAEVQLMPGLWFLSVTSATRVPPRDWIAAVESAAEALDLRLAPKTP